MPPCAPSAPIPRSGQLPTQQVVPAGVGVSVRRRRDLVAELAEDGGGILRCIAYHRLDLEAAPAFAACLDGRLPVLSGVDSTLGDQKLEEVLQRGTEAMSTDRNVKLAEVSGLLQAGLGQQAGERSSLAVEVPVRAGNGPRATDVFVSEQRRPIHR